MSGEARLGEYLEIATFSVMGEAMTAAATLEAAGIPFQVRNEQISSVLPHMANAFGGIGLCVPADDAVQARELLDTAAAIAPPDDGTPPEPTPADAPESPSAAPARMAWLSAVLGLFFLPVILNAVSVWHVVRFLRAGGPASRRSRWQVAGAIVFDLLAVAWLAALIYFMVSRRAPPNA